jgi:hypothetical protein
VHVSRSGWGFSGPMRYTFTRNPEVETKTSLLPRLFTQVPGGSLVHDQQEVARRLLAINRNVTSG